jgi:hypothetical protein
MSFFLLCCMYYQRKGDHARSIFEARGFDGMYHSYWIRYKLIFYKPEK